MCVVEEYLRQEQLEETTMRVGFVGLGTMGAGMAANIQKGGYKITVTDLRQEAAAR